MSTAFPRVYHAIGNWARLQNVEVRDEELPKGKAGEFNGVTVTMNRTYDLEERAYYLIHALGSIVTWSLDKCDVQAMFDELRAAKEVKAADAARFERAILRYRAFEIGSSEFAVWLLADLSFPEVVAPYTNFMRADLEAMTRFHREGIAPVWHIFFSQWNEDVARGRVKIDLFEPKPVPSFHVAEIEKQEILQQQDRSS